LLDAHRVRVLLARLGLERAVGARGGADVRQVEVAVDVEEDLVAVEPRADGVGEVAEPGEVVRLVQRDPVVVRQPLTGQHLVLELALVSQIHTYEGTGTRRRAGRRSPSPSGRETAEIDPKRVPSRANQT